ncbi:hypothetical protein OIU77_022817 [Salix suchowensis]|uniref:Uncharacterized protein n=1 Tax=Salix suchowensis TaxID=1278906 RepID=A0ABQ9C1L3_9ROSI|nr:hypothetical protein OIU77_022817 [Salix suchowensis]
MYQFVSSLNLMYRMPGAHWLDLIFTREMEKRGVAVRHQQASEGDEDPIWMTTTLDSRKSQLNWTSKFEVSAND